MFESQINYKILILCSFCAATLSYSFQVNPIVETFDPSSAIGRSKTFFVENSSDKEVAVEVTVYSRNIDEKGHEARQDSDQFMIYPEQFKLGPKEKRAVRATWLGENSITTELPFRFLFEQLPVEEKVKVGQGTGGSIGFRINYLASVYVTPQKPEPAISVKNYKRVKPELIEMRVVNTGNAHLIPEKHTFVIKDATNKNWELDKNVMKPFRQDNLLAGSERVYTVRVPKNLPEKDLQFYLKSDVE